MPSSVGGTTAPLNLALFPLAWNPGGGTNFFFNTFDPTNFNDPNMGSFYNWKVEDILAGRTPTCSRVIVQYRDLGQAQVAFNLTGTHDDGSIETVTTGLITIGTLAASGRIITAPAALLSVELSAQNIQLSVTRAANAGPVSIVKVRLEGRVEITPYA